MKHYVYKIINKQTGSYYIGSRSHVDPEKDPYMGSSKILSRLISKEGVKKFDKIILQKFSTRKQANQYEHKLTQAALLEHPEKVYNMRIAGATKAEKQHNLRADIWNDYYDEIREKYTKVHNMTKLAREYNTSVGVISKVVEDIKVKGYRSDIYSKSESIISSYEKGRSLKSLSEEYNCDIGTIKTVLNDKVHIRSYSEQYSIDKDLQIKKRKPLIDLDIDYVKELYFNRGMTVRSIAEELNIYSGTLFKRMKEAGIEIRSNAFYRKKRHPAWNYEEEIKEDSKYLTKKALCDKYSIKDYSTLNRILKET